MKFFGVNVRALLATASAAWLLLAPAARASGYDQTPAASAASAPEVAQRAEAYYDFLMGHYYEERYGATSRSEYASQAIDFYKKALELNPNSSVVAERLAEVYAASQRIRDAVLQAQEILKRDPDNLAAHRLLARIYVRTLGDAEAAGQKETLGRAIGQYQEIVRLDPSDTEAALWLARLYRFQNDHEKAEQVLRKLLGREPANEAGLEQFTQLMLDEGRAAEAITRLQQLNDKSPNPRLLDLLGNAYAQLHEDAKSEQAYRKAAQLDPSESSHLRGLAQALLSERKYDEALAQYQRLAQLDPDEAENYLRMAQIYRQVGKLGQAESSILRAKEHAPDNLEVVYNEALIYRAQGRFDNAIRLLSDAVARLKKRPEGEGEGSRALGTLYEQLGRTYREAEDYPAAIRTFQEMSRLSPAEDRQSRLEVIETYRTSRQMEQAVDAARQAMSAYPQDRDLKVSYALLLAEKGDADEGAKTLRALLNGSADDRETYLQLAEVYERGRHYAEAEQAARTAEKMARQPADNDMAWFLLGAIYERQKKYDLAEQEFRRVLEVNPHNAAALNYYGYMLADRGTRLEEATELIQRALAEESGNAAYLDSLGWAYFKQNKLAEAEEYLRKATERDAHDPTILAHLGEVYDKTGRPSQAAQVWEKALAEWRRVFPADYEADKVAELQKKLETLKHHLAQKSSGTDQPQ